MVDLEHRENERLNNKTVEEVSLSSNLNFSPYIMLNLPTLIFNICKLRGKPGVRAVAIWFCDMGEAKICAPPEKKSTNTFQNFRNTTKNGILDTFWDKIYLIQCIVFVVFNFFVGLY